MPKRYFHIILLASLPFVFVQCASSAEATKAKPAGTSATAQTKGEPLGTFKRMEFERYFYDGIREKMNENYTKAAYFFGEALGVDPKNDAANYEMAYSLFKLNKTADAETYARQAYSTDNNNKWYGLLYAEILQNLREFGRAGEVYAILVRNNPKDADLRFNQAAMYVYQNKPQDALRIYDEMQKEFGESDELFIEKYRLYSSLNKHDKAAEEVRNLIGRNPDVRYYTLLAETYAKAGQKDKEAGVYEEMLKRFPNNPQTQLALADYYQSQGENGKAYDMVVKAFRNNTLNAEGKVQYLYARYLGQPVMTESDSKGFNELLNIVLEVHPDYDRAYTLQGDYYYGKEQWKDAAAAYEQSLDRRSNVFGVWQQYLLSLSYMRDYKRMVSRTEQAMELFPSQPLIYFFNGIGYLEQDQYKKAVESLETGLAYVVDNHPLKTQIFLNLAEAQHRLGNHKESDEYFEQAIATNPNNGTVLNNYAYYLSLRSENLARAEEMSRKSLELEPSNASFLDTYGWIMYQQADYKKAAEYIRKSLEQEPLNAEVNEHLGDVLFKMGQHEEALRYWQKAQELGSKSSELQQKIRDRKMID